VDQRGFTPSSKRKFHFGEPSKCFFGWVMGQSKWLIAKKKVQLVRHPQPLNIRMNNQCLKMESSRGGRFYRDNGLRGGTPNLCLEV